MDLEDPLLLVLEGLEGPVVLDLLLPLVPLDLEGLSLPVVQ